MHSTLPDRIDRGILNNVARSVRVFWSVGAARVIAKHSGPVVRQHSGGVWGMGQQLRKALGLRSRSGPKSKSIFACLVG